MRNKGKQNAVIRSIEIIGEAVKNLPDSLKEKYSDVRWRGIAGFGDVLVHGYFRVDLNLLWKIVKEDVPTLKIQIEGILTDFESE